MGKIGFEASLYYQTDGVAGTAGWNELDIVADVSMNASGDEVEVTTRKGNGWKQYLAGLKDATIEFEAVWDAGEAGYEAIRDAWLNRSNLGIRMLDGDFAVAGSEGLEGDFVVTGFQRNEPIGDKIAVSITLKPALSDTAMQWIETVGV